MTVVTWLAILVLGPGALAVFALFLRDVRGVLGDPPGGPEDDAGGAGESSG